MQAAFPIMRGFAFDAVESGGVVRFVPRDALTRTVLAEDDLVPLADAPPVLRERVQEADLPTRLAARYINEMADYRSAAVSVHRDDGEVREVVLDLPVVMEHGHARQRAEIALQDAWTARETASFALPPSRLALEPTDVITLDTQGGVA